MVRGWLRLTLTVFFAVLLLPAACPPVVNPPGDTTNDNASSNSNANSVDDGGIRVVVTVDEQRIPLTYGKARFTLTLENLPAGRSYDDFTYEWSLFPRARAGSFYDGCVVPSSGLAWDAALNISEDGRHADFVAGDVEGLASVKGSAIPKSGNDAVLARASDTVTVETYHDGTAFTIQVVAHRQDTETHLQATVHAEAVWASAAGQRWLVTIHSPYTVGDDVHQRYFDGAPWPIVHGLPANAQTLHAGEAYIDLEGEQQHWTVERNEANASAQMDAWVNARVAQLQAFYAGVSVMVSAAPDTNLCLQGGR